MVSFEMVTAGMLVKGTVTQVSKHLLYKFYFLLVMDFRYLLTVCLLNFLTDLLAQLAIFICVISVSMQMNITQIKRCSKQ